MQSKPQSNYFNINLWKNKHLNVSQPPHSKWGGSGNLVECCLVNVIQVTISNNNFGSNTDSKIQKMWPLSSRWAFSVHTLWNESLFKRLLFIGLGPVLWIRPLLQIDWSASHGQVWLISGNINFFTQSYASSDMKCNLSQKNKENQL